MSSDLLERLANYRTPLDDAIAADLAARGLGTGRQRPRGSRLLVAGAAAAVVVVGIAALAWSAAGRPSDPPDPAVVDQPETTASASIVPVAPEPTSPPTFTAEQPEAHVIDRLAIGDSIMLGAAHGLAERGFTVDAVESRAFVNGLEIIVALEAQGRLGDVVVVHLGTNGPISTTDMTEMMEALADVPQVLLLTIDVPRDYSDANNSLIYETASAYPNTELLDWAGLKGSCAGTNPGPTSGSVVASNVLPDCFYDDGFHLRPAGQRYYVDLIDGAIEPAT